MFHEDKDGCPRTQRLSPGQLVTKVLDEIVVRLQRVESQEGLPGAAVGARSGSWCMSVSPTEQTEGQVGCSERTEASSGGICSTQMWGWTVQSRGGRAGWIQGWLIS